MATVYLCIMLAVFSLSCLKLFFGELNEQKMSKVEKESKNLISTIGTKNFINIISLFSGVQIIVAIINYMLFSLVVPQVVALTLGLMSITIRTYIAKRSTSVLEACFRKCEKPITVWIRYSYLKRTPSTIVIYLDTFIVFYTLLHI